MKNKGFTLVELLAVIIIISLLAVVAVPSTLSISKKIRDKMLNTKLSLVEKNAIMWAQDNKRCFSGDTSYCASGTFKAWNKTTTETKGEIKICKLAVEGYYEFDDESRIKIENPSDNNLCINDYTVEITYNAKTQKFSAKRKNLTNTECANINTSNYCS